MEITATAAANSSSVLNGVSRSKSDTIEGNLLFFHFIVLVYQSIN